MAKNTYLVEVKDLTKIYGDKTVVKGISFSVKTGEIFGILGPNGAGKTTTMEMIEAMRPIDDGEVYVAGIDVTAQPMKVKEVIGIQLQSSAFFDKLTLREQLAMFASMYGESDH